MDVKRIKYPKILAEMDLHREGQKDLAKLLNVKQPTIWRKLMGRNEWKISEIEILCKHYKKKYEQLFK